MTNDSTPKYPEIEVELSDQDGNAFVILGLALGALRKAGVPSDEIEEFQAEATSGDYEHLLATVQRWVEVS